MRGTAAGILLAGAAALAGCGGDGPSAPAPGAPAGPEEPAGDGAEDRYWEAWQALEVEHRPADALPILRAVADDPAAAEALRGRALLLVARCERLMGRGAEAEKTLRSAMERHGGRAGLRARIQEEQASLAGARVRYVTGILGLAPGQYLDFDAGGIFDIPSTPSGGLAEATLEDGSLRFFPPSAPDPDGMGALMPWLSDAPWVRLSTERGGTAWVQSLREGKESVVRFVTRLSGEGPVLGPPRDPFCVGREGAIDVRFGTDPRYAAYRIERRVGAAGAFEEAGRVEAPPYTDGDVEEGVRYGYRITGLAAGGDEGIPATVQGTTRSRGIVRGSCRLRHGAGDDHRPDFDFLREEVVKKAGDLQLESFWGNRDGASFLDPAGRHVLPAPGGGGALRTPWTPEDGIRRTSQLMAGAWFLVGLRGGGVARCRMTMPVDAPRDVQLDYEVCPDADAMPEGPALAAEPLAGGGAAIRVAGGPAGSTVATFRAVDLRGGTEDRILDVADGSAVDPRAVEGTFTRYEAVATDPFGRSSATGSTVLNRLPRGVLRGEFSFHYRQGWSIERGREAGPEEADLYFESCAGGISSITFSAAGGIRNLDGLLERERGGPEAAEIHEAVVRADPRAVELGKRADGDSRIPAADVFLLRTRSGGWAKVAIVARGSARSWTEYPATVRFAWNPHEPVFEEGREITETRGGIGLAWFAPAEAAAREIARRLPGKAAESGKARDLLARLDGERVSINGAEMTLEDLGSFLENLGVPVEFAPEADRARPAEIRVRNVMLGQALDGLAAGFGCTWRITEEGRVRFEAKR